MDYVWIVCSCFTRILYGDLHIGYLEYNLTVTVNRCTSTVEKQYKGCTSIAIPKKIVKDFLGSNNPFLFINFLFELPSPTVIRYEYCSLVIINICTVPYTRKMKW